MKLNIKEKTKTNQENEDSQTGKKKNIHTNM